MRKTTHLIFASLFFIANLSVLPALAHDDLQRRAISTNGFGEVKVKPNMAVINLCVRAHHQSGKAAKQDVDDRVNNFLAVLKKIGIREKDIVASSLRVSPRYEHYSGSRQFKGYEATRTLTVTLYELSDLTDVMDKALENRLEGIDQISYDHSEADKYQAQAHQLAIENSKTKARALAAAYDTALGPVITINYHHRNPVYGGMKAEMSDSVAAVAMSRSQPGTYIADELVFSDSIQVSFDLIVSE